MKMDGYVVVPPLNPWDEKHKEQIWLGLSYSTFSATAHGAWQKHGRIEYGDPDRSKKIQHWHNIGYRIKKATLEIHDEKD
jgi:hypothetical protein